mmetsp:Transcript_49939/g.128519  ORF Transcript_49939/g.128519 Transcript_49939/m.128519 type:complete len:219 (+) Transcript_49939:1820-2476(+)
MGKPDPTLEVSRSFPYSASTNRSALSTMSQYMSSSSLRGITSSGQVLSRIISEYSSSTSSSLLSLKTRLDPFFDREIRFCNWPLVKPNVLFIRIKLLIKLSTNFASFSSKDFPVYTTLASSNSTSMVGSALISSSVKQSPSTFFGVQDFTASRNSSCVSTPSSSLTAQYKASLRSRSSLHLLVPPTSVLLLALSNVRFFPFFFPAPSSKSSASSTSSI